MRVTASDGIDIDSQAIGLNVGLVGAGVTIASADKNGATASRVGDSAGTGSATQLTLDDDTLQVSASRSGRVSAQATAGAGGIIAGSGADASAIDAGAVQALLGNAVAVASNGATVQVLASATPQLEAQARGVNIGAGAVGASLATAVSNAMVSAELGAGVAIDAARPSPMPLATRSRIASLLLTVSLTSSLIPS